MENGENESELFPADRNWDDTAAYSGLTLLHSGALADTWRVRKAGKYFLAKAVHGKDSASRHFLKREYEIAAGLDHPNIASVFTFDDIEGPGSCIVMEYVDGQTLSDFLKTDPPLRTRKKIAGELISAVGYLHRKGIIHNDLKPENILISSRDSNLKLIDFGLSDDDTHLLRQALGCTPSFASPELLAGRRTDARSDIYSLGCILKLIFPQRYSAIIAKCCRTEPSRRYASAEDVLSAMRRSDACRWILPCLLALAAVAAAVLLLLGRKTDITEISVPAETVLDTVVVRQEPADTLYDTVCRDADRALDSLFRMYSDIISKDVHSSGGLYDAGSFCLELEYVRDQSLKRLATDTQRADFNAVCDLRLRTMHDSLKAIVRTLPDKDCGLTPEEIWDAGEARLNYQKQLRRRLFGE